MKDKIMWIVLGVVVLNLFIGLSNKIALNKLQNRTFDYLTKDGKVIQITEKEIFSDINKGINTILIK